MTSAVIDASTLVRATIQRQNDAQKWVMAADESAVFGLAPDLMWAEYANALCGYVRAGIVSARSARRLVDQALKLRFTTWSSAELAVAALLVAVDRG